MQVPFQNNATCNRTCVYKLVDNAYFNVEDSYIARARPAYVTTDEAYAKVRPRHAHSDTVVLRVSSGPGAFPRVFQASLQSDQREDDIADGVHWVDRRSQPCLSHARWL